MTARSGLAVVAAAGIMTFALSFVPGWLVHHRELTGEGYRTVTVELHAWRDVARPIVSAAVIAALATALAALAQLLVPPRAPRIAALVGSTVAAGLLVGSAWPVSQAGFASSVSLTPGWALIVAIGLAAAMVVGSFPAATTAGSSGGARAVTLTACAILGILLVPGASAARAVALHLEEGDGRHWQDGSYTRQATAGEPTETLTFAEGRYAIGDRWSGTLDWSGWTVVLTDDPACPEDRGSYHVHAAEEDAIRFVRVVDRCAGGARERALEAGIWERDP